MAAKKKAGVAVFLGHDLRFWIAIVGVTVFKLLTSQKQTWRQAFVTVLSAVLAAWLATDAVLAWMDWDVDTYKALVAALIALVSENMMRSLITLDLEKIIKIWKDFKS